MWLITTYQNKYHNLFENNLVMIAALMFIALSDKTVHKAPSIIVNDRSQLGNWDMILPNHLLQ